MQTKPGDTPKVIGLVIAIIAVLGFLVWRLVQTTQSAATTAGVTPATTAAAANAPLQTASARVPESTATATGPEPAGAGQMRYFDDALDADPPQGQIPSIPPARADAFRTFKAPPATVVKTPVRIAKNPPLGNPPTFGGPPAWAGGSVPRTSGIEIRPTAPPASAAPPVDVKLDGVVLGPDGFAMLTITDFGARGSAGAQQSVYKRVGEKIAGHVITGMSDAGIEIRGYPHLWPVGQALHFGPALPAAPPVQTPAPAVALPNLGAAPVPNSAPLQPPTVTR
jgi:hypothetical protein